MPSTEVTKTPDLLDLEYDHRDWFSEFREERALQQVSPRREGETLFAVVTHGRPAPIVLADAPVTVHIAHTPAIRLHSLIARIKRAFSPSLTALLIFYVAAIWLTASIGINKRQNETARDTAEAALTSPAASVRPAA